MSTVIITSECEDCRYGEVREESKARIRVFCSYKDKMYWYGQCVQCDSYSRKEIENAGDDL